MMKRIGIEVNGVLRDSIGKFKQIYEKHFIEEQESESFGKTFTIDMSGNTLEDQEDELFKYEIISEVDSLNLINHFKFKNEDELYSFMYEDFVMQIFGHAGSTETFTFNHLNNFYMDYREKLDMVILSDEIGKSKPATLFFLSKFGCLVESVIFYSMSTKDRLWNNVDVLLTSNPENIINKPNDKTVIKFITDYNKTVECDYEISSLSELDETLKKLNIC